MNEETIYQTLTVQGPEGYDTVAVRMCALEEAVRHLNPLVHTGQIQLATEPHNFGASAITLAKRFEHYITTGEDNAQV